MNNYNWKSYKNLQLNAVPTWSFLFSAWISTFSQVSESNGMTFFKALDISFK